MAERSPAPPDPASANDPADNSEPQTVPQIAVPPLPADAVLAAADPAPGSAPAPKELVELPPITRAWMLLYALSWYVVLLIGLAICHFAVPAAISWALPLLLMAPILLRAAFAPQRLSAAVFHRGWSGFGWSALEGITASLLLPAWLGGVLLIRHFQPDWCSFLVGWIEPQNWSDFLASMAAVGIGEELFFRGFLQHELSLALNDQPHLGGWRLGRGFLLATVLFGVAHVVDYGPGGLLTFFPALIFGWLYARRRQIVGPAIFHFSCNILAGVVAATGVLS